MITTMIHGSKQLGADLHQWHSGMDAIYGVGSMFYARRGASLASAQEALEDLQRLYRHRKASRMPAADARSLASVIRRLTAAIGAPRKNPTKSGGMNTAEAVAAIPKHEISYLVGAYHVGTPSAEIEERVRTMATKAKWPAAAVRAGVIYARKCHARNVELYRSGRF